MSSPVLDFAVLLAPIPGDEPAGKPVPYPLRQKLRAARKETEPHPDDPSQPDIPRRVDWAGLNRLCQDTLTNSSKDLEVALQLTEALSKVHYFAGLRDGLHLLADLLTNCWDWLHPIPEPGEGLEDRAERFHWISESDRGALFPVTIKSLPLVKIDGQAYSFLDRQLAQEGRGPLPGGDFERSVPVSATVGAELDQCLEELGRLDQALQDRFGNEGPSLMGLRQALEECNTFLQFVRRKVGDPTVSTTTAGPDANGSTTTVAVVGRTGSMATREDAYRQLSQIADFLEQLEPHSPIPDLLRRAIELGRLPFRKLIHELIREPNLLAELRREFGIKEGETTS